MNYEIMWKNLYKILNARASHHPEHLSDAAITCALMRYMDGTARPYDID